MTRHIRRAASRPTFACDDTRLAAAAEARGVGVRALSPMYVDLPPQSGLILGYSGFSVEAMAAAAAVLCDIVVAGRTAPPIAPGPIAARGPAG